MISIIIPVYQCKWNIEQILSDIEKQTYQDYEVLLVDDGSTDGSAEVCQEYERRDSRIRAILKEHSGVGKTRNKGLECASGEYIAFIDADDRIEPDYLEQMLQGLNDSELVISSFDRWFYDGDKLVSKVENKRIEAFIEVEKNFAEYFSELYVTTLLGIVYCKLFNTEIIRKNGIAFRNDIYIGEDFCFNFDYLRACHNINCIPYMGYHYVCTNGNSLTHKKDLKKYEYGKILFRESIKFGKDMNLDMESMKGIYNLYLRTCFKNIETVFSMENKLSPKDRHTYMNKIVSDEETQIALKYSKPDSFEFLLYKIILKLKVTVFIEIFSWMRLKYKMLIRRV